MRVGASNPVLDDSITFFRLMDLLGALCFSCHPLRSVSASTSSLSEEGYVL